MLKFVQCLAFAALSAATLAAPASAQSPAPTPMTMLIYEAGPAWKAGRPVAEQGLGPHLGYVATAFKEGKVVAYGTEVSTTVVRGYYVLKGTDAAAINAFVAADPGITGGVLKRARSHNLQVVVNGFRAREEGQRYTILRMQAGPKWAAGKSLTEQNISPHFGYMVEQAKAGVVLAAAPDGSGQEGWYVVRGDKAVMDKLLASDPGVKSGLLKPVAVGWDVIGMQAAN